MKKTNSQPENTGNDMSKTDVISILRDTYTSFNVEEIESYSKDTDKGKIGKMVIQKLREKNGELNYADIASRSVFRGHSDFNDFDIAEAHDDFDEYVKSKCYFVLADFFASEHCNDWADLAQFMFAYRPPFWVHVRYDILYISYKKLNENVEKWGKKIRYARISERLTQQSVADLLCLKSHSPICDEEGINTRYDVPLSRLEAYSLIYHMLPSVLLNLDSVLTDRHLGPSAKTDSPEEYEHVKASILDEPIRLLTVLVWPDHLIYGCLLYAQRALIYPKNEVRIKALHVLSFIGAVDDKTFQQFSSDLMDSNVLSDDLKEDLGYYFTHNCELSKPDCDRFYRYYNNYHKRHYPQFSKSLDYKEKDTLEYIYYYVYLESESVKDHLLSNDSARSGIMAKLASMDLGGLKKLIKFSEKWDSQTTHDVKLSWSFIQYLNRIRDNPFSPKWPVTNLPYNANVEPDCLKPFLPLTRHLKLKDSPTPPASKKQV